MRKTDLGINKKSQKHDYILDVRINSTSSTELLKEIESKLYKKLQFYIVTPNPEIILIAQKDTDLLKALNEADYSIPDGEGLKFAVKNLQVIKGRKFMVDILKLADQKKMKVYLLGSRPFVNERAIDRIKREYPGIKINGNCGWKLDNNAEPISEVDSKLEIDIVQEINKFGPDFMFVAFGAPKQEKWIKKNISKLNVGGVMAVGGSLDYFSGTVREVPKIMEDLRLEWLWRLVQEPGRIGRIFNALIVFPLTVLVRKVFPQ